MKYKLKAFTLTELLIALGIIGAIAAISIPSLMNTINNRMLVTQLKSNLTSIQQLASDTLVIQKVKNLEDTAFGNPAQLLTEENFSVAKTCANPAKDCWNTEASGTNKVIKYKVLDNMREGTIAAPRYPSIILKNGAILAYNRIDKPYGTEGDKLIGDACIDVNGNEPPNIGGRDYFCFYVTNKAKVIPITNANDLSLDTKITKCKAGEGSNYCTAAVIEAGWNMPY